MPRQKKERSPKYCLNCGDQIHRKATKYCSNKCQGAYQRASFISRWKSGKITKYSRQIRAYLFEKFGSKCSRCGWCEVNPHSGLIPLEVEHIDGNSDNNQEENLTLICPNCHSLTATFRALNKGNGRYKRRQRFLAGKSF